MDVPTAWIRAVRARPLALTSALLGVLIGCCGPAPVEAATIDEFGSVLTYRAGPGEANNVQFTLEGSNGGEKIRITDSGTGPESNQTADGHPVLTTSTFPACLAGANNEALCDLGGVTTIRVVLGDGADTVGYSGLSMRVDVDGGTGGDSIIGMGYADQLDGGAGGDTISGGSGDDTLTGGPGDDILRGGGGDDSIDGGDGADQLQGEDGNDDLVAGAGSDKLDGGGGDDTLDGGLGGDALQGGDGVDTVSYADRTTPVNVDINNNPDDGTANEGDDVQTDVEVVVGGQGDDRLAGRDNSDAQTQGKPADDDLSGGPGNDVLIGRGGDDKLDGGTGADQLDGGTGADTIAGGAGEDNVTYGARTAGVSITLDGAANDGASGEGDNIASDIEDLYGGAGNDTITGTDDRNLIGGLGGNDTINGAGGDDVLNGGEGADTIAGGDGKDVVNYAWENAPVSVTYDGQANDGADGEGDNLAGDVEGVIATGSGDELLGGPSDDFLYGYGGDDILLGGPGRDLVVGGEGNDRIQTMDDTPDFISCGEPPDGADPASDADVALVDPLDSVSPDCETKVVGTAVTITTPGRGLRAANGTVAVPVTCQQLILDGCSGTLRLTTRVTVQSSPPAQPAANKTKTKNKKSAATKKPKTTKKPATTKPRRTTLELGTATFQLAPGQTGTAVVTLSQLGAALLKKAGKLTATASAANTDVAGGVSKATQSFLLRR